MRYREAMRLAQRLLASATARPSLCEVAKAADAAARRLRDNKKVARREMV